MKKYKKANIDNYRGLFLQVGLLLALFLVWVGMEWTNPQHQPRNKNVVGIEMDVKKIVIRQTVPSKKQDTSTTNNNSAPLQIAAHMPQANLEQLLKKTITKNKQYPNDAKLGGIKGKVLVNFQLNSNGRMVRSRIVRSIHPLLDQEALRIIKQQSNHLHWATQPSKNLWFCIPIVFQSEPTLLQE